MAALTLRSEAAPARTPTAAPRGVLLLTFACGPCAGAATVVGALLLAFGLGARGSDPDIATGFAVLGALVVLPWSVPAALFGRALRRGGRPAVGGGLAFAATLLALPPALAAVWGTTGIGDAIVAATTVTAALLAWPLAGLLAWYVTRPGVRAWLAAPGSL